MTERELPKIRLESPALSHSREFLAAVAASRGLHAPWASPPATPTAFRSYLDRIAGPRDIGYFIRAQDGGLAGVINISEIVRGAFKSAYLGYYGFEPYAGRGHMTAGMAAVLRRAFRRHRLHRLEANIQPENRASISLVQRLGFRREGLSRRYLKIGGRWQDHERWAILAEDVPGRPTTGHGLRPVRKVELRPLTRDNWRQCAGLELGPGQDRLVASNLASLAESRFAPNYEPRAVYADGEMAGFLMYCPEGETYWIFRLMTAREHQQRGIGARAVRSAIREIAERGGHRVRISHVPDNEVASRLYQRLGFVPTGEIDDGEVVLELELEKASGL